MSLSPAGTRVPWSATILLVALLATSGCSTLRTLAGPRLSGLDLLPAPLEVDSEDHRDREQLLFLVVGDSGTDDRSQHLVASGMASYCAARGGCDFVLGTGDNFYDEGVGKRQVPLGPETLDVFRRRFESAYEDLGRTEFWMVTGNHDWYWAGTPRAQVLYSTHSPRWRMPGLDYTVPKLPEWLRIVALDTTLIREGVDTGQLERARESLCSAPGWRILFAHHPPVEGGSSARRAREAETLRRTLSPTLIGECGVQVYFAGHDHFQAHLSGDRLDVFVQGAGGRDLHEVATTAGPDGFERLFADATHGFAAVAADATRLQVDFFAATAQGTRLIYSTTLERPLR